MINFNQVKVVQEFLLLLSLRDNDNQRPIITPLNFTLFLLGHPCT